MDDAALCLDPCGILRGQCIRCAGCQTWTSQSCKKIRFKPEEANGTDKRPMGKPAQCEKCGCPADAHESLEGWLHSTRRWVQRLCCSDGAWPERAPPTGVLPVEAKDWAPEDAALHVVTGGQFEPGRDGRGARPEEGGEENLVSVVCTTLEKDHASHDLLYENFRRQTYEPRELVVVDSGTAPSPVLLEKAQEDSRVTYRFFFREEHGLEQAEDPFERVLKRDDPDDIIEWTYYVEEMPDNDRAEVRWEGLSLGLKRNIACHLARGAAITHFNVNAFYAPDYVSAMLHELTSDVAQQARRRSGPEMGRTRLPAAVCLGTWHTLDMDDEEFRLVDTEKRGSEVAESKRQQVQYGKGLTYTYTRSCWELAPFPDVEEPEGRFGKVLKQASIPFRFVQRTGATLAAHGYLKEGSSGESASASINLSLEIRVLETCSVSVSLPKVFVELMPLSRAIVTGVKLKQGGGMSALLQAEGACFFCIHCDAAIALRRYLKTIKKLGDGAGGKVEIAQFSRAGGAVAEGVEATYEEPPKRQVPRPAFGPPSAAFGNRAQIRGVDSRFAMPAFGGGFSFNRPLAGKPHVTPGKPLMGIGGGGLAFGAHRPTGFQNHQATSFQSHQARAPAAQARALGRPFPMMPQRGGFAPPARQAPEPDPTDAAWFPGWWRRNAACRHCGNNIGWRYENEEKTIFWVLETQFLREREPEPEEKPVLAHTAKVPSVADPLPFQPSTTCHKQPVTSVPSVPKVERQEPAESPPLLAAPPPKKTEHTPGEEERQKEQPKEQSSKEAAQEVGGQAEKPAEKPAAKPAEKSADKPADKTADKSLDAARQAIRAFSPELKQLLALGVSDTQRARFDQALNEMKLDGVTRQNLLKELKVRPGVAATQVEHLVAKSFKAKINALRSLGLRVLRVALQEELPPGAALDRLAEAVKKDNSANGHNSGKGAAKEQDKPPLMKPLAKPEPEEKRQEPAEDKPPLTKPLAEPTPEAMRQEPAVDTPPLTKPLAQPTHEGRRQGSVEDKPSLTQPLAKPETEGIQRELVVAAPEPEVPAQTPHKKAPAVSEPKKEAHKEIPKEAPKAELPAQTRNTEPLAEVHKAASQPSKPVEDKLTAAAKAASQPSKPVDDKQIETGRQAIRAFSPALQQHLAVSVGAPDKAKFDATLNEMKLDDATRKNILQELRVRPGVAPTQVEHLVAKNFKGKINTLRSQGLRVLRASLEKELPGETLERLAAGVVEETPQPVLEAKTEGGEAKINGADHCPPGPLPVPEGWEAEWSEPCQCYKYYDDYGQMHHEPPAADQLN